MEAASGFRIARAGGVESEIELAFAALHQLCAPGLDRLERLPGPQRDVLGVAFGLRAGEPPDRFLVGLAVLGFLSEVAFAQPLAGVGVEAQLLARAAAAAAGVVARRRLGRPAALCITAPAGGRGVPR